MRDTDYDLESSDAAIEKGPQVEQPASKKIKEASTGMAPAAEPTDFSDKNKKILTLKAELVAAKQPLEAQSTQLQDAAKEQERTQLQIKQLEGIVKLQQSISEQVLLPQVENFEKAYGKLNSLSIKEGRKVRAESYSLVSSMRGDSMTWDTARKPQKNEHPKLWTRLEYYQNSSRYTVNGMVPDEILRNYLGDPKDNDLDKEDKLATIPEGELGIPSDPKVKEMEGSSVDDDEDNSYF